MAQTYITFLVGLIGGILSIGSICLVMGKWVVKAVVKEVLAEVAGNWVPSATGTAYADRISRLERQFDDSLKTFAAHMGETGR